MGLVAVEDRYAQDAWNISRGDSNVLVGVADVAIYSEHPDLQGRIYKAYNIADGNKIVDPPSGQTQSEQYTWSHGTHVSGIIEADQDNRIGITGIAPKTRLLFCRGASDSTGGEYLNAAFEAVIWLANNNARIISMSWGSEGYSISENSLMTTLYNEGILLIAAGGNTGSDTINYPGGYDHVISVGSTNDDDHRSSFSEYGKWLSICAPGGFYPSENVKPQQMVSILSTTFCNAYILSNFFPGQKYDMMQGTSMATPVIAGIAALMLSVDSSFTPDKIMACLKQSAKNLDTLNPSFKGMLGAGRANAYEALKCVQKNSSVTNYLNENNKNQIILYPNPAQNLINLMSASGAFSINNIIEVKIYNEYGQVIKSLNSNDLKLDNSMLRINVASLSQGLYLLELQNKNVSTTRKFMVIR